MTPLEQLRASKDVVVQETLDSVVVVSLWNGRRIGAPVILVPMWMMTLISSAFFGYLYAQMRYSYLYFPESRVNVSSMIAMLLFAVLPVLAAVPLTLFSLKPPQRFRLSLGSSVRLTNSVLVTREGREIPLDAIVSVTYHSETPLRSGLMVSLDAEVVRISVPLEEPDREPVVRLIREHIQRRRAALVAEGHDLSTEARPSPALQHLRDQNTNPH